MLLSIGGVMLGNISVILKDFLVSLYDRDVDDKQVYHRLRSNTFLLIIHKEDAVVMYCAWHRGCFPGAC